MEKNSYKKTVKIIFTPPSIYCCDNKGYGKEKSIVVSGCGIIGQKQENYPIYKMRKYHRGDSY